MKSRPSADEIPEYPSPRGRSQSTFRPPSGQVVASPGSAAEKSPRGPHLWDRERFRVRVLWKRISVWLDLTTRGGVVRRRDRRVEGAEARELLDRAFASWVNDSFWLHPIAKIRDEGTVRSLVEPEDDRVGLLVEYTSGGLTPGDADLWTLGPDGFPVEWRMWTSNLPVGGVRATWEGWVRLATGAWIATEHSLRMGSVNLQDVEGAASLAELVSGKDPFAVLDDGK